MPASKEAETKKPGHKVTMNDVKIGIALGVLFVAFFHSNNPNTRENKGKPAPDITPSITASTSEEPKSLRKPIVIYQNKT